MRKRLDLQKNPLIGLLTQRLWLLAKHEAQEQLSFREYETYMLRLHRLILPEFDLVKSSELIQDDWTRDSNGQDHLAYRSFHLAMFELVGTYLSLNRVGFVLVSFQHRLVGRFMDGHRGGGRRTYFACYCEVSKWRLEAAKLKLRVLM
jgi:hypothetical protein